MAGLLAESRLMTAGRTLYRQNETNWDLPMSRIGKLKAGGYIILRDYADGLFPPKFEDQQKAYDAEKEYCVTLPGMDSERLRMVGMQKPFWSAKALRSFMGDFIRLAGHFADLGIRPRSRILELGCGKGWMAEALAQMGYDVLGTTLAEMDVAENRAAVADALLSGLATWTKRCALFLVRDDFAIGWKAHGEMLDERLPCVLVPLAANSVFRTAVTEGLFTGEAPPATIHDYLRRAFDQGETTLLLTAAVKIDKPVVNIVYGEPTRALTPADCDQIRRLCEKAAETYARLAVAKRSA